MICFPPFLQRLFICTHISRLYLAIKDRSAAQVRKTKKRILSLAYILVAANPLLCRPLSAAHASLSPLVGVIIPTGSCCHCAVKAVDIEHTTDVWTTGLRFDTNMYVISSHCSMWFGGQLNRYEDLYVL